MAAVQALLQTLPHSPLQCHSRVPYQRVIPVPACFRSLSSKPADNMASAFAAPARSFSSSAAHDAMAGMGAAPTSPSIAATRSASLHLNPVPMSPVRPAAGGFPGVAATADHYLEAAAAAAAAANGRGPQGRGGMPNARFPGGMAGSMVHDGGAYGMAPGPYGAALPPQWNAMPAAQLPMNGYPSNMAAALGLGAVMPAQDGYGAPPPMPPNGMTAFPGAAALTPLEWQVLQALPGVPAPYNPYGSIPQPPPQAADYLTYARLLQQMQAMQQGPAPPQQQHQQQATYMNGLAALAALQGSGPAAPGWPPAGMPPAGMHSGTSTPRRHGDMPMPRPASSGERRPSGGGIMPGGALPVPPPSADPVLALFKETGCRRFSMQAVLGHVVQFALDQHGSRFIQVRPAAQCQALLQLRCFPLPCTCACALPAATALQAASDLFLSSTSCNTRTEPCTPSSSF